jgi:glycosyltransferase involved in cell wall biosynthesis
MSRPRNITLIVDSLGPGGAERVISTMGNYWARRGWRVVLLTMDPPGSPRFFYELDPAITHRHVRFEVKGVPGLLRRGRNIVRRQRVLRREILASAPDIVISFLTRPNIGTVLAARGMDAPIIISERCIPTLEPLPWAWRLLRRLTYRRADCMVAQTQRVLSYFPAAVQARACVIPNPVAVPEGCGRPPEDSGGRPQRRTLAMGRLGWEKRFDLLIAAFAQVAPRYRDWGLEIWGEGPDRACLEAQAASTGLGARIRLPGQTREPYRVMRQSDLFVLSSQFEGFPNVLCEAMACGLPVISFDCPCGPREIISDGLDGVLVPAGDVSALATAMSRLMGDGGQRARLGARAQEVRERYSLERIMALWEGLIDRLLEGRAEGRPRRSSAGAGSCAGPSRQSRPTARPLR